MRHLLRNVALGLAVGVICWKAYGFIAPVNAHLRGFERLPDAAGKEVALDIFLFEPHGVRTKKNWEGTKELGGEGNPTMTVTRSKTWRGLEVLTLAMEGYTDDSVKGERWRWILEPLGAGRMKVLAKGRQQKCWRGFWEDWWTTSSCP